MSSGKTKMKNLIMLNKKMKSTSRFLLWYLIRISLYFFFWCHMISGLLYLHSFAGRCVIHRDVKSSNILLDHSMCAKVADFGFSKYAPQEGDSGVSLEVRGTAGYLDPE